MNEDESTEIAKTATPKRRSVGFPQMPLGPAVEAIVTIGRNGGDHSQDAASAYLGHSTPNSGAFRAKLASLRDWGLIARGDRNRVILSELAKDLVLAVDEGTEHELVMESFFSCAVFKKVYDDQAKNIPLDEQRLRTVIVMRHGVASDQADKFVASFVDSVVYARLGSHDGGKLTLSPEDAAIEADVQPGNTVPVAPAGREVVGVPHADGFVNVGSAQMQVFGGASTVPVALRQSWPIDGGEIEFIIRTPKAMPPDIYALMAEMAAVAKKMEELLKPKVAPATMVSASTMSVGGTASPAAGLTSGSSLGGPTDSTEKG